MTIPYIGTPDIGTPVPFRTAKRGRAAAAVFATLLMLGACNATRPPPTSTGVTGPVAPLPEKEAPRALPAATIALGSVSGQPASVAANLVRVPQPETANVAGTYGLSPPHLAGKAFSRVAVLLPFSSATFRDEARNLLAAAELALFDVKDRALVLMPIDSGETEASARRATEEAIANGADAIIGPLLAAEVRGTVSATSGAAGRPIIAFSSDSSVAGPGTWLLSALPEQETRRIVDYAARQGVTSLYIFAPDDVFGRRAALAAQTEAQARGLAVPVVEFYPRSNDPRGVKQMEIPAKTLATALRRAPAPPGKRAIFIPDRGDTLRAALPLIAGNGVDPRAVRILGISSWSDTDLTRESSYFGAWFAAPDPTARAGFVTRFEAANGRKPSRISSYSYDATALMSALNRANGGPGILAEAIQHEQGFLGTDGLFRFGSNGLVERGLAIIEVSPQGPVVREAGAKAFASPGS